MKKNILFLILLSFIITSNPASAKDPAIVRRGFNQINKGYINNAIPTLKKAVSLYPNNINANLGLAIAAEKQGGEENLDLAINHFKKVLELEPNNFEANINLAKILSWNKETRPQAIDLYENAIRLKPNDKKTHYQYAEVLLWDNRNTEASSILSDLYNRNPNDLNVLVNYANALTQLKQYNKSLDMYETALSKNVKLDSYTNSNYARTLANTGNASKAIDIYNSLIQTAGSQEEHNNIKKEYASILFDSGDYRKALDIDKTIEPEDENVLLRMARSYDKLGMQEEAVNTFEKAYSMFKNDPAVVRSTANYLASLGGYTINATNIYEELLNSGNATTQDKIELARLYVAKDSSRDKGIELYRDLLNDSSLSASDTADIKLSYARALAASDTTRSESVQIYRELLSSNPDNMDINIELLEVLSWDTTTRREAISKYYELLTQYPDNNKLLTGFNQALIWYLPEKNDLDLYEKIITRYPDNTNALKDIAYIVSKNPETSDSILSIFKKSLNNNPNNTDLQFQVAELLALNKSTRKESLEWYEKVHQSKPDDLEIMVSYANNLLYLNKYKDAKKIFDEILSIDSENKDALLGKARVYNWQGLNLSASKEYEKAYNIYPDDPDIAYEYAGVAKKLGQKAKALRILSQINRKSLLPEAPEIIHSQELAMAINYQSLYLDTNNNNNDFAQNSSIDKIEQDLINIQKDLEKLQAELNKLDNNDVEMYKPIHNNQNSTIVRDIQVEELEENDYKAEILPEPVTPFEGRIISSPTMSVKDDIKEEYEDLGMKEVVFNPGGKHEGNIFRTTAFQDALSGKKSSLMNSLYGQIEEDIYYSMRPEIRTSFILSNEAGNSTSDALEIHGYPTFMSFNITPQNRFRFGINSSTYGMSTAVHPASITMTSYTMGLNSKLHERVELDGELTISSFSDPNAPVDVTANVDMDLKLHDRAHLNLGYRRAPLYESVLETTGYTTQPQYSRGEFTELMRLTSSPLFNPNNTTIYNNMLANPNYYDTLRGPFLGQVRDNAVNASLTFLPFNKWDLTGGYEYSSVRGENIENNGRHQAIFSVGRTFTGVKDHLFRIGYQFLFFGYRKQLSAFPNMTPYPYYENGKLIPVDRQMAYQEARNVAAARYASPADIFNDPTGATVTQYISPVDFIRAPRGVGIGGYFSPTQYYQNSLRFDFEGKLAKGRVYYRGGATLGIQQIGDRVGRSDLLAARGLQDFANVSSNDPRLAFPAFKANYDAAKGIRDTTDPTSIAAGFDMTLFLKVTDFLTFYSGVDYLNSGAYDRWRYNGGLIFRPNIKALTPIFRKPPRPSEEPASDEESIMEDSEE